MNLRGSVLPFPPNDSLHAGDSSDVRGVSNHGVVPTAVEHYGGGHHSSLRGVLDHLHSVFGRVPECGTRIRGPEVDAEEYSARTFVGVESCELAPHIFVWRFLLRRTLPLLRHDERHGRRCGKMFLTRGSRLSSASRQCEPDCVLGQNWLPGAR